MIFTLGTTDVRTKTYDDFESLEKDLLLCEAGSVYAGQKKGTESAWNMIAVTDHDTGEYFGLGVLCATNKEPHILATENNMLFIQAHPFRNWMMVIDPRMVDGVEVFNGHFGHDSRNEIANMWAERFNLIKTSGTDFHYITSPANGGIFTEEEITDMAQLIEILKSGNYTLNKDC